MSYSQHLSLTIDYKSSINILTSLDRGCVNRGYCALSGTVLQPTCGHSQYSTKDAPAQGIFGTAFEARKDGTLSDVCVVQTGHIVIRLLLYDTDESPALIRITADLCGESVVFTLPTLALYYIPIQ